MKKTLFGAFLAGAAATIWWNLKKGKTLQKSLTEKEDIDAYNADDKQGPFEEKAPRQRSL